MANGKHPGAGNVPREVYKALRGAAFDAGGARCRQQWWRLAAQVVEVVASGWQEFWTSVSFWMAIWAQSV